VVFYESVEFLVTMNIEEMLADVDEEARHA